MIAESKIEELCELLELQAHRHDCRSADYAFGIRTAVARFKSLLPAQVGETFEEPLDPRICPNCKEAKFNTREYYCEHCLT